MQATQQNCDAGELLPYRHDINNLSHAGVVCMSVRVKYNKNNTIGVTLALTYRRAALTLSLLHSTPSSFSLKSVLIAAKNL